MTLNELIDTVEIEKLYTYMTGEKVRGHRARATWRDGDSPFSVCLYPKTNSWYDFAQGEGGGVLTLVQKVENVKRNQAVVYLEDYLGVNLDDSPAYNPEQQRIVKAGREAAQNWREAAVAVEKENIESLDRLKEYNDVRYGALSNRKNWIRLCGLQKESREEVLRLQSLRGESLLDAYREVPMGRLLELSLEYEKLKTIHPEAA